MFVLGLLLACGESVVFEEPEPVAEAVEGEAPEVPDKDDYNPVTTPEDGRKEIEAQAQPKSRKDWPPVVIPGDQREREWEWNFEHKGGSKQQSQKGRDIDLDEMRKIELEDDRLGIDE